MKAMLSAMSDAARWEDEDSLKNFLAEQLYYGRLSLVLGAGASIGFGFPNWDDLVTRAFVIAGVTYPSGKNNEDAAEDLLTGYCQNDDILFANLIRRALYQGCDISLAHIRQNDLLAAIGAIVMSSRRGNVSKVISYNFEELLELYLNYYGFDVNSVPIVPAWALRSDVTIYHPHGFLPSNESEELTRGIVFAQIHYDRIVGKLTEVWRQMQIDIFRSTTCLFIGLSGNDANLRNMLAEVKDSHVSRQSNIPFWGVRFSDDEDDPKKNTWLVRGVFQHTLPDYKRLPEWLFDICQRAAQLHRLR